MNSEFGLLQESYSMLCWFMSLRSEVLFWMLFILSYRIALDFFFSCGFVRFVEWTSLRCNRPGKLAEGGEAVAAILLRRVVIIGSMIIKLI